MQSNSWVPTGQVCGNVTSRQSTRIIQGANLVQLARKRKNARRRPQWTNTYPRRALDRECHGRMSNPFHGETPAFVQNMLGRMTRSRLDGNRGERYSYRAS